jgi:hypothetical protein
MTGSTPVLVIAPIVVVISLAAWIALVFYADAHPAWRRGASSGHGTADPVAGATAGRPDGSRDGVSGRPEESQRRGGTRKHTPSRPPRRLRAGRGAHDSRNGSGHTSPGVHRSPLDPLDSRVAAPRASEDAHLIAVSLHIRDNVPSEVAGSPVTRIFMPVLSLPVP